MFAERRFSRIFRRRQEYAAQHDQRHRLLLLLAVYFNCHRRVAAVMALAAEALLRMALLL